MVHAAPPTPPAQPPSGPGGAHYVHQEITAKLYDSHAQQYWLFEPQTPTPLTAPVLVFLHGWGATHPRVYSAWIAHLVKRGNLVIYPRYQGDLRTPPQEFMSNTMHAVHAAFTRLETEPGHVRPQRSQVAVVGHSVGGILAANLAAMAQEADLPVPKAVMSVQPGKSSETIERLAIPLADLQRIPKHVLLLTVVGDQDRIAQDADARRIFYEASQIPRTNKNFVVMRSDMYGFPGLQATHFAPLAVDPQLSWGTAHLTSVRKQRLEAHSERQRLGVVDALDYYGFWKLFDALCQAAFEGTQREYALGDTRQQRFMGTWSDGTAVKELVISNEP